MEEFRRIVLSFGYLLSFGRAAVSQLLLVLERQNLVDDIVVQLKTVHVNCIVCSFSYYSRIKREH